MDKLLVEQIEAIRAEFGPVVSTHDRAEIERKRAAIARGEKDQKSLLEVLEEIWARVPQEEWDELPDDLGINLDHYLYGVPKVK